MSLFDLGAIDPSSLASISGAKYEVDTEALVQKQRLAMHPLIGPCLVYHVAKIMENRIQATVTCSQDKKFQCTWVSSFFEANGQTIFSQLIQDLIINGVALVQYTNPQDRSDHLEILGDSEMVNSLMTTNETKGIAREHLKKELGARFEEENDKDLMQASDLPNTFAAIIKPQYVPQRLDPTLHRIFFGLSDHGFPTQPLVFQKIVGGQIVSRHTQKKLLPLKGIRVIFAPKAIRIDQVAPEFTAPDPSMVVKLDPFSDMNRVLNMVSSLSAGQGTISVILQRQIAPPMIITTPKPKENGYNALDASAASVSYALRGAGAQNALNELNTNFHTKSVSENDQEMKEAIRYHLQNVLMPGFVQRSMGRSWESHFRFGTGGSADQGAAQGNDMGNMNPFQEAYLSDSQARAISQSMALQRNDMPWNFSNPYIMTPGSTPFFYPGPHITPTLKNLLDLLRNDLARFFGMNLATLDGDLKGNTSAMQADQALSSIASHKNKEYVCLASTLLTLVLFDMLSASLFRDVQAKVDSEITQETGEGEEEEEEVPPPPPAETRAPRLGHVRKKKLWMRALGAIKISIIFKRPTNVPIEQFVLAYQEGAINHQAFSEAVCARIGIPFDSEGAKERALLAEKKRKREVEGVPSKEGQNKKNKTAKAKATDTDTASDSDDN